LFSESTSPLFSFAKIHAKPGAIPNIKDKDYSKDAAQEMLLERAQAQTVPLPSDATFHGTPKSNSSSVTRKQVVEVIAGVRRRYQIPIRLNPHKI
jgi:hypothetical protein